MFFSRTAASHLQVSFQQYTTVHKPVMHLNTFNQENVHRTTPEATATFPSPMFSINGKILH
jgi:hypothetical protein